MLKEWRYCRATKGYFNPEQNVDVSRDQLLQIFHGQVVNPQKLKNIYAEDYSYLIVGVPSTSPLNSWAGIRWGSCSYENARDHSIWYGRFSVGGDSHIIFPGTQKVFDFHSLANGSGVCTSRHFPLLNDFPGLDLDVKNDIGRRTLVSNLGVDEVAVCVRDVFQDRVFFVGKSL